MHAFLACTENVNGSNAPTVNTNKEILVLFEPNALGDYGYNDLIYRGLIESMNGSSLSGIRVNYYNPGSMADAGKIIRTWKEDTLGSKNRLLVLANSTYRKTLDSVFCNSPLDTTSRRILLFESKKVDMKGVHTFNLSLYGTSYISGAVAGKLGVKPLMVMANSTDSITEQAADGFSDGFEAYGGNRADIGKVYLSDSNAGYSMADSVYKMMYDWVKTYNFIFPVIGGSAKGVYRYIRETPKGLFTVGVDVDQSDLCTQIVGSMVKRMDTVFRTFLENWAIGKTLPASVAYGLHSGYTDWVQGHVNLAEQGIDLEEIKAKAIQKESEHESF